MPNRLENFRKRLPFISRIRQGRSLTSEEIVLGLSQSTANFYVQAEVAFLELAGTLKETRANNPWLYEDYLPRNLAAGIFQRAEFDYREDADELIRLAEAQLIGLPTKVRVQLKLVGLNAALGFWEEKLESPDATFDEVRLANSRIVPLKTELELLKGPKDGEK